MFGNICLVFDYNDVTNDVTSFLHFGKKQKAYIPVFIKQLSAQGKIKVSRFWRERFEVF